MVTLVSSSINSKVLLSWQVLRKLGVIPDNFSHIDAKAAVVAVGGEGARVGGGAVSNTQEAREAVTRSLARSLTRRAR